MQHVQRFIGIAGAAAAMVFCSSAVAQSGLSYRLSCQSIGTSPPEPLGDREGHAVAVGQYTCRTEGGPLDGGVLTGNQIWEYDKTNAVGLAGNSVTRKPGAYAAAQVTESKLALTVADGRVTGFTGSGRAVYVMAIGSAAPLKGKTFSYTFQTTGPFQFAVDVKVD
jgi:hypothetical protein